MEHIEILRKKFVHIPHTQKTPTKQQQKNPLPKQNKSKQQSQSQKNPAKPRQPTYLH